MYTEFSLFGIIFNSGILW